LKTIGLTAEHNQKTCFLASEAGDAHRSVAELPDLQLLDRLFAIKLSPGDFVFSRRPHRGEPHFVALRVKQFFETL